MQFGHNHKADFALHDDAGLTGSGDTNGIEARPIDGWVPGGPTSQARLLVSGGLHSRSTDSSRLSLNVHVKDLLAQAGTLHIEQLELDFGCCTFKSRDSAV